MNNSFNDDDKKRVIDFLNFVAKKASFKMNTQEAIDYYKMLSFMQQTLLVKIDSNILEIKKVVAPELPVEVKKESTKKSK